MLPCSVFWQTPTTPEAKLCLLSQFVLHHTHVLHTSAWHIHAPSVHQVWLAHILLSRSGHIHQASWHSLAHIPTAHHHFLAYDKLLAQPYDHRAHHKLTVHALLLHGLWALALLAHIPISTFWLITNSLCIILTFYVKLSSFFV